MLRIAICDDEIHARDTLWVQLDKILREGAEEIVYDFSSGSSALNWLKKHPGEIDLLFLDVEMPGMDGMEAARQIRTFNKDIMIVFVTGYDDYVFDGYSVGAMDYLMKPVSEKRLNEVLHRVREKLLQKIDQTFVVKNTEGTFRFLYKNILYFYSEKRKVFLVTENGEYDFYGKLNEVEEKLTENFVRIHQRFLVNASAVSHIDSAQVTIENGDGAYQQALPISRAYRESASKKIAKAMLQDVF